MTTDSIQSDAGIEEGQPQLSLGTAAARNLATVGKSLPQMQGISSRWLLRMLPWVQTHGGVFRVNRRQSYTTGDGRIEFVSTGSHVRVVPEELCELPVLRGFHGSEILATLAGRFEQRDYAAGDVIVEAGQQVGEIFLIAHGKISKIGSSEYGEQTALGILADGDYFGEEALVEQESTWDFTAKATTACTVLALPRQAFQRLVDQSEALRAHIVMYQANEALPTNEDGEAIIKVASGHVGEPELPGTYVDYEESPREYELSVAQTVLRVHTRVSDLYNGPWDQTEQQLRLTIEALRERQEYETVNNPEIGLLNNADFSQRIFTRSGPPTPDDLDELLALVWKEPSFFFAHPRTIAAFGRECNRQGLYPQSVDVAGSTVPAWRGIPLLPCNKIPITDTHTSSIMLMRVGVDRGVIGLEQSGIPDEVMPSVSTRFMGISEKAIMSYLVSVYYSVAVLVPDALAILESVELGREG